jgi:hypothetical protein
MRTILRIRFCGVISVLVGNHGIGRHKARRKPVEVNPRVASVMASAPAFRWTHSSGATAVWTIADYRSPLQGACVSSSPSPSIAPPPSIAQSRLFSSHCLPSASQQPWLPVAQHAASHSEQACLPPWQASMGGMGGARARLGCHACRLVAIIFGMVAIAGCHRASRDGCRWSLAGCRLVAMIFAIGIFRRFAPYESCRWQPRLCC